MPNVPLGSAWAGVELRLDKLEANVSEALSQMDKLERGMKARAESIKGKVGQSLETLGRSMTISLAMPLAALGAAAVKAATDMDSLRRGMTAVTGSSEKANREIARLKEVAKLPGLGFKEAIEGSINLQAAGYSADQARKNLMAFGNALATVGKGKADLDFVTLALTQLANRTSGFGQEIRQLQEHLPQIRQMMIKAFGTADSELIGKIGITGKQFVEVIANEFAKLPKMTGGIKNSFENASDAAFRALSRIGETMLPAVASALDSLSDKLAGFAKWWSNLSGGAQRAILGTGGIVALFSLATLAVGTFITKISEAAVAIRALVASAAFSKLGATLGLLAAPGYALYKGLTEPGYMQEFGRGMGAYGTPVLPMKRGANYAPLAQPARSRPAQVDINELAGRFEKSIGDINQELGGRVLTQERRAALLRDRQRLIADALKLRMTIPGVNDRDAGLPDYAGMIRGLQDKKAAAAAQKEAAKAKREAEKAQRARDKVLGAEREAQDALFQATHDQFETERREAQQRAAELLKEGANRVTVAKMTAAQLADIDKRETEARKKALQELKDNIEAYKRGQQAMKDALLEFDQARAEASEGISSIWKKAQFEALQADMRRAEGLQVLTRFMDGFRIAQINTARIIQEGIQNRKLLETGAGIMGGLQGMGQKAGESFLSAKQAGMKAQFALKQQFDWMREFASNMADEFYYGFGESLQKLFGKNIFGRAIARTLEKWFSSMLDNVLSSAFAKKGGGAGGEGMVAQPGGNVWGSLAQLALGGLAGGLLGGIFKGIGGIFKFDDPVNDRRAVKWGWDFGSLFTTGALRGAQAAKAGAGTGGNVTVNIAEVNMQSEMDVPRVARQLAWQVKRELLSEVGR